VLFKVSIQGNIAVKCLQVRKWCTGVSSYPVWQSLVSPVIPISFSRHHLVGHRLGPAKPWLRPLSVLDAK
jgi:hypothetical protein